MLDKDQVSWDRFEPFATTALGRPRSLSASGFPIPVKGDWQEQSGGTPKRNAAGLEADFDVIFFSAYEGGKSGDRVSFQGRTYVVGFASAELKLFSSGVDYCEYRLKLVTSGVAS